MTVSCMKQTALHKRALFQLSEKPFLSFFFFLFATIPRLFKLKSSPAFVPLQKKRGRKEAGDHLFWWPGLWVWFRLLRECVPDYSKGLTAIVYCSTRQDLAPICIKVRAGEGRGREGVAASSSGSGARPQQLWERHLLLKRDCVGRKWKKKEEESSGGVIDCRNERWAAFFNLKTRPMFPFIRWVYF